MLNPMLNQILMQSFGNNPNFNRAMQMIQGKTPEQLQQTVMNLAQNQGISMQQLQQFAGQYGFKL